MPLASPNTTKKGQASESKSLQQTDEILNSILPPRLLFNKMRFSIRISCNL
jgi:hypothetical protein